MKKLIAIIVAVLMMCTLWGCASEETVSIAPETNPSSAKTQAETVAGEPADTSSEKPVVKIGGNFVQSGGGSAASIDWSLPVMQIAVEEFNAGEHAFTLQLVTRDCANDASLVGEKNTELKNEGCVAIVGPNSGGLGIASLEWANENQLPTIATGFTPSSLMCKAAGKYGFNAGLFASAVGNMMGAQIAEQGYKSVYYVGNDASDNLEIYQSILKYFESTGYPCENLGQSWFGTAETEYTNVCSAAIAADPDCIICIAGGPSAVSFLQTGRLLGLMEKPLFSTAGVGTDSTVALGSDFPLGIITFELAPWYVNTDDNADYVAYAEKYYSVAGTYPSNFSAGWGVGAYGMIAAIEAAFDPTTGTASPDDIVAALETITFDSPMGKLSFLSADEGHLPVYDRVYLVESVMTDAYDYAVGEVIQKYGADFWPKGQELTDSINSFNY